MAMTIKLPSSFTFVRSGFVMFLLVTSMVLHLHMRVIKHFAYSHQKCQKAQQIMDFPAEQQQQVQKQAQVIKNKQKKEPIKEPAAAAAAAATPRQLMPSSSSSSPSLGLHAPNSTALPLPNDNGMILFYLHIPKTGGTTMMAPFVKHPDWKYRMVFGFGKQTRYRKEMYDWLDNWEKGTKVYYEYHAGTAAPYMDSQVREDLLVWRAMAKVRNVPFFAFTVVREPLSMAVSHFNFYYAASEDPRYFWVPNPTEKDFMELGVPDPQCLFAIKSELAYYKNWRQQGKPIRSTQKACQNVYDAMVHDFDWIGTTEGLSTQTFPILEQLGEVRYCPEVRNQSRNRINKRTLSQTALDFVHNTTQWDRAIYEQAQKDFPYSMWSNLDRTPKEPRNPKKRCKYRTGQALPPGELPKRAGERRRFLDANPDFVEFKGSLENHNHLKPHYLNKKD